jgi:hypothetical protein
VTDEEPSDTVHESDRRNEYDREREHPGAGQDSALAGLLRTLIEVEVARNELLIGVAHKLDTTTCILERISRNTCETVNEVHRQSAFHGTDCNCATDCTCSAACNCHNDGGCCTGAHGRHHRGHDHDHDHDHGHGHEDPYCVYEPCQPREPGGGTAVSLAGSAEPNRVYGAPFPPAVRDPNLSPEQRANTLRAPDVPQGPFRGFLTPGNDVAPLDFASGGSGGDPDPVVFGVHTTYGSVAAPLSTVAADVSGAESGNIVLVSGNWYATYSNDGGTTFTSVDPTTIFDNTADGGFCCDQIIQYAPSIDRFLWLMQFGSGADGKNRLRIASASPETVASSNCTSWTYWDLTSDALGVVTTAADAALTNPIHWLDYPNMSIGDGALYLSIDNVGNGASSPATGGRIVVRIPLQEIAAAGTVNYRYTDWANAGLAYAGHVSQNTGDQVYWAGHRNNSTMQVFNWPESSTSYSWRDVGVNNWPNGTLTSTAKNGNDWLTKAASFPKFGVIGATRRGNEVWFAWNSSNGTGASGGFNFPNANIQVVKLDPTNGYQRLDQFAIWNNGYAFAYPALATNDRQEVGIALGWGGTNDDANSAVGILGDFVVWFFEGSTASGTRWGDYITARQASPQTGLFAGFGYATLKDTTVTAGLRFDPFYVLFGRNSIINPGSGGIGRAPG